MNLNYIATAQYLIFANNKLINLQITIENKLVDGTFNKTQL